MPSITELAAGPVGALLGGAKDLLGKFITDPEKKLEAQTELAKLQGEYQSKLLDADVAWAKEQSAVIQEEIKSESWLAKNWRPITMLVFVYIIAHNFVIAQLFSVKVLPIPDDMWQLLKLGLGGYIIGRSVEKTADNVAPVIAAAITAKKD